MVLHRKLLDIFSSTKKVWIHYWHFILGINNNFFFTVFILISFHYMFVKSTAKSHGIQSAKSGRLSVCLFFEYLVSYAPIIWKVELLKTYLMSTKQWALRNGLHLVGDYGLNVTTIFSLDSSISDGSNSGLSIKDCMICPAQLVISYSSGYSTLHCWGFGNIAYIECCTSVSKIAKKVAKNF